VASAFVKAATPSAPSALFFMQVMYRKSLENSNAQSMWEICDPHCLSVKNGTLSSRIVTPYILVEVYSAEDNSSYVACCLPPGPTLHP
jgi:hypothetical protein